MSNLVEIANFFDPEEAYCAKGYLLSHGIETIVQNEHHLTMSPWLRIALGGYRLLVCDSDETVARKALSDVVAQGQQQTLEPVDAQAHVSSHVGKRNWLWLPLAFFSGVPFVPFYKSRLGQAFQFIVLVVMYLVLFGLGLWSMSLSWSYGIG